MLDLRYTSAYFYYFDRIRGCRHSKIILLCMHTSLFVYPYAFYLILPMHTFISIILNGFCTLTTLIERYTMHKDRLCSFFYTNSFPPLSDFYFVIFVRLHFVFSSIVLIFVFKSLQKTFVKYLTIQCIIIFFI